MIRQKLLFPGERSIKEKCHTVEKLAEPAEKQKVLEDCYQRIKEAASDNHTSQRCHICHYQNHTVCSCQVVRRKIESVFFCGEFTQHPDEKMRLREQKNKIKALETSAAKLEQELTSQEAAFDRVQGVCKQTTRRHVTQRIS